MRPCLLHLPIQKNDKIIARIWYTQYLYINYTALELVNSLTHALRRSKNKFLVHSAAQDLPHRKLKLIGNVT